MQNPRTLIPSSILLLSLAALPAQTAATATFLGDLHQGSSSSKPDFYNLTRVGKLGFFPTHDGSGLACTDGTKAGTRVLLPLNSSGATGIRELTDHNGRLYFRAQDPTYGAELWVSDGTVAGTRIVADWISGKWSSDPDTITSFAGRVWYNAYGPNTGSKKVLHVSNGNAVGTRRIFGVHEVQDLTPFGRQMLFTSRGTNGRELWTTDGSDQGAKELVDIVTGAASSDPRDLTVAGGKLYFTAYSTTSGRELYVTDGTAKGTTLKPIVDIYAGPMSSDIGFMKPVGDRVFFTAKTPAEGRELWVSDGTSAGTRRLTDIKVGTTDSFYYFEPYGAAAGDKFVFKAGTQLWVSDGTTKGTFGLFGGAPHAFLQVGSRFAYFCAYAKSLKRGVWRTDGTAAGTSLVAYIGSVDSNGPDSLGLLENTLLVRAHTANEGFEPWALQLGAISQTVRPGCQKNLTTVPKLKIDDPVMGQKSYVTVYDAPLNKAAAMVIGLPADDPWEYQGCNVYLDMRKPVILETYVYNNSGFQIGFAVPQDLSLIGVKLWCSVAIGDVVNGIVGMTNTVELFAGN